MEQIRDEKFKEKNNENYWLFAEFWQIICLSIWYENDWKFNIKSLVWDEKKIIWDFFDMVWKNTLLVGHNLIWFDLPFITKRAIIHWFEIPESIKTFWKKPWEIKHLDTMTMWKHTSWTNTSLDVLCNILNIESPKNWDVCWANLQAFWDKKLPYNNIFSQKWWTLLSIEFKSKTRYEVVAWLSEAELKKFYRVTDKKEKLKIISEYCENDVIATYKVFKILEKTLWVWG